MEKLRNSETDILDIVIFVFLEVENPYKTIFRPIREKNRKSADSIIRSSFLGRIKKEMRASSKPLGFLSGGTGAYSANNPNCERREAERSELAVESFLLRSYMGLHNNTISR